MTPLNNRKLMAGVLTAALLLPATTAFGNDWSKPKSRLKGSAIGGVAGAVVAGPPGAVVGAAVGNGVQVLRHKATSKHYRHHRKY
jgi:MFS superfamily sulfate permease-like transporter